jgi:hypothetical protein
MVLYTCNLCNKSFTRKSNYESHKNRKKICTGQKNKIKPINNTLNSNSIMCNYCKKIFTHKNSLYRHISISCKVKQNNEKEKEIIFNKLIEEMKELKEEIKKIKSSKTKVINNNIQQNNIQHQTNNIKLVCYGMEDMSRIDEEIKKSLMKGFSAALDLTDRIHFNPKYPEYHNIYIPNIKEKYAMVYKNDIWNLILRDDVVDDIYDTKKEILEESFKKFYKTLNNTMRNSFEVWLNTPEDDKKILQIKERIKLLLFNKRNMIINSANKVNSEITI